MYHRERAYNSFNPALRCDSPLSSQMSEKSTTLGREGGKRVGREKDEAERRRGSRKRVSERVEMQKRGVEMHSGRAKASLKREGCQIKTPLPNRLI